MKHELKRISTNKLICIKNIFLFLIFLFFISCKTQNQEPLPVEIAEPEKTNPRYEVTFIAAGDNLFHETIINTHRQSDGTYNFDPIYTEIKALVQSADLAFINQETVMAGPNFAYQGYPTFNTPQSLAKTLRETGFDIFNLANNHAMDMGRTGLYNTLDLLDTFHGITVIGARKSGKSWRIVTRNNISLGFLSYTFSLNGIPLPAGEPNLVSMINRTRMTEEIAELRPLCDFLIVSMHWGDEYMLVEPVQSQKDLALFLAEQNVDLIIGHHPHVLQRAELLPRPDGKETLCFYSLGNFVSHQNQKERVLGAMLVAAFSKEYSDDGEILSISNYGLIPVVTHYETGHTNTKAYPLYSYTQEILDKHMIKRRDSSFNFEFIKNVLNMLDTKIIMYNPF